MDFFRKIWCWLSSPAPKKSHKKWHPDLNPIDIKKISSELNLRSEAHRLGSAGVPRDTDQQLAGPEAAVVHRIEEVRQDYMNWGELRLASLNQELARKDISQQINQARKADDEFERIASAELTAKSAILRDLAEVARARKEELDLFRQENHILRLPINPTGIKKIGIVVLALALVAIEAVLNMQFFAKGLDTGLIGGFSEAAVAAAINIGVSFISGWHLVRLINHTKALPKFFGWIGIVITASFIITMALGIAHYRDALVIGTEDAMGRALQTLLASPAGLQDMSSWMLFMVSIVFGAGAVFDGYKMDDPFPGYGKKSRLAEEAVHDYDAEIEDLHGYLDDTKTEALDKLDRTASQAEASVVLYKNLIGEKERAGNDLSNAVAGAEHALHALLQEFRDENKIARGNTPVPEYFNCWPQLRELKIPNFSTSVDEVNLASQRRMLKTFLSEVQDIRARIQTAFNERFNALHTLDNNFVQRSETSADAPSDNSTPSILESTRVVGAVSSQGAA
jgi:hypothetical protein